MSRPSLIAELETALRDSSPDRRLETLRRVTDAFLADADRLTEQQIAVFDDVLIHLAKKIENKALVQLSVSLAGSDHAPLNTIRHLSRHDEIEIAGPVLSESNRLTDDDLVHVGRSKGQGHLLAISGRATLSPTVTDTLIARKDPTVMRTLADNAGAQFSYFGFTSIVKSSESDDELACALGARLDLPRGVIEQLMLRATDLARSRILASASPQNREQVQSVLAAIAKQAMPNAGGPRDYGAAEKRASELNRRGKLNEAALAVFARDGHQDEVVATIALFCAAPSQLIARLIKNVNSEGLIIACKAAKLTWPTTLAVLRARHPHHALVPQEIEEARKSFVDLSQSAAQRTIRFMIVKETTKAS